MLSLVSVVSDTQIYAQIQQVLHHHICMFAAYPTPSSLIARPPPPQ